MFNFIRMRKVLLTVVIAWALAVGKAASAQTSSQEAGTSSSVGLEEIVVTAQRREENSQKVPIAVTAINAAALETSNVTSALDIGKLVPTAVLQTNNGYVTTFLRGIGSTQTTAGNEAEIPVYIDGVYIARLMPVMLSLNNVDRIEVLEGPQGTLFGRNSTGGLVQIVTRTPTPGQDTDVRADLGYGNYQTVEASSYLGVSLGPKLAADFALVYHNQFDGWGRDLYTGTEFNRGHSYAGRTKWVFDPVEGTHIVLTGDYAYEDTDIGLTGLTLQDKPQPNGSALTPAGFGFYDSDSELGSSNHSTSKSRGVSLRAEQDIPFARLIDISAYRNATSMLFLDSDGRPELGQDVFTPNYDKQFTQELQLVSNNDSNIPLTWTLGAFYMHHRYGYLTDSFLAGSNIIPVPGATLSTPADGMTNSYSGYGQATYHATSRLDVTAGVRYTEDRISGNGGTIAVIPGAGPGGSTSVTPSFSSAHASFGAVSWKGAIDYKVTDDAMVYGSVSRGFKAGLFNILTFSPVPIRPETVTAYELGFKSEFDDHRVRLNGALFWDDIKDFQTSLVQRGLIVLTNANAARSRGIELNANARATRNLTLRASAAYLDAKYTDFQDAPFYTPVANPPGGLSEAVSGNADGHTLPRASKFTGNVGFDYTVLVATGEFTIGAGYSYTSPFHWDPDNLVTQSSINLVDASITYALASTGFKVRLWGSNLTGTRYYTAEYEIPGPLGVTGAAGAPRLFGINFTYQLH